MGCLNPTPKRQSTASAGAPTGGYTRIQHLHHTRKDFKNVTPPGRLCLTPEEQDKLYSSWCRYAEAIAASLSVNAYTLINIRHPHIFNNYFKSEKLLTEEEMEAPFKNEKFARHLSATMDVLSRCMQKAHKGELWHYEDALRRLGSTHAELWITTKDMLYFEESFIWSLTECDPNLQSELKDLWLKFIRVVLLNIVVGLNSHYEKLMYVLEPQMSRKRFCLCHKKTPVGIDQKANTSLRRMSNYLQPTTEKRPSIHKLDSRLSISPRA